ncbi:MULTISPECIES: NAD(P)-binding protein [unclassified Rhodococcus (in: high G+C Gram-positive bacteria)]|uniref:NAD(P)-binding protein n=1 Tax=unclassified Rhodococcus (in: high G+C Gram-positive bacteria) TaxID=192944 RepID=UPI00092BF75E|nr:NAD(P)-binding protein [Rhodococcus sp. M8]OLL17922.1 hypothetical protein BKE56_022155 [Rhodococcus sp. M8]QPG46199.1 NAD(P)-binding protein [Rhodococcus sp. M8]
MPTHRLETDYLVIGCGAAGMAFADALITDSDADVVMVDRRHAPGGHWQEAYPFVRLHQPSAYYGVNSLPLGTDTIDDVGPNRGMYEQAGAPEICAYYDRVMRRRLLASGSVRYFPMSEYVGGHRFVSRVDADRYEVTVRKALVDATYLEPAVPATFAPPFDVAPAVRCVPVNALARVAEPAERYVVIGAGKTAIDACLWLLQMGVPSDAVRWIKPREAWLRNRWFAQGGELVGNLIDGLARQMEAAALATSTDDLFARLEASEQLLRVDERVTPTMYKGPTASTAELAQLRRIDDVVRLGHVRRIARDEIVLDHGTIGTGPDHLHVHCAAPGLNPAPAVPIFEEGRITLQPIRTGLIPFNAALVGFVEATGRDLAEKNRLCPPNRLPDVPLDWIRGTLVETSAEYAWSKEPDMADWLERSRLNTSRGLRHRADRPLVREATRRFATHVRPALANLTGLLDDARRAA